MKRIGTMGVVVTFVAAAATALAGCCTSSPQPSRNLNTSAGNLPGASLEDRQHPACTVYTPQWPYSAPGG
jgi:hypothetical protein